MATEEWLVRVELPKQDIDQTFRVSGGAPWTAMNRAVDEAIRMTARKNKIGGETHWAGYHEMKKVKNQPLLDGLVVTLIETPATRKSKERKVKEKAKKENIFRPILAGF